MLTQTPSVDAANLDHTGLSLGGNVPLTTKNESQLKRPANFGKNELGKASAIK